METPKLQNLRIGDVLKQDGLLTDDQIQQALAYQKEHRDERLGAIFVSLGFISETQMLSALATHLNLRFLDLDTYPVNFDAVAKIPRAVAEKYAVLGIDLLEGKLLVAVSDPLDFYSIEDIKLVANMDVTVAVAQQQKIREAIRLYYTELEARSALNIAEEDLLVPITEESLLDTTDESAAVVRLFNSLLIKGMVSGASDIHIEPFERKTVIRMRIDGMLIPYATLPANLHLPLIVRLKILSNLDIAERRVPQDGHFKTTVGGHEMNTRISVIPTVYGEKAVIRYLSSELEIDGAAHFGMTPQNGEKFRKLLECPYGIVYITGPTGSGKSTTLYMALEYLSKRQTNITTIEDPVERNVSGVNQMQVNNTTGLTFERGLRAILRQDPDVIMVGETRDAETASISIRAAITGHLVLSTLHTNDALSALVRLQDMGVEPYLLSSAVVGVIAQRLVKKICPHCKTAYKPSDAEKALLGAEPPVLYKGRGCHICNHTGYKGRIAVHEVIAVDRALQQKIVHQQSQEEMEAYVRQNQDYISLRQNLVDLVLDGTTTVEELMRTTYFVD